jgi:glycosyltransferase involved in cell wall biosynthesis
MIGDRGIDEWVRLAGFQADALELINAADVLVLPSPDEPFGLVLLEAMALGKPTVACRSGAPPEIVDEQKTGLLFAPRDASSLAQAMLRLLSNPEHARRMGEAGRERFAERFTSRQMAAATKQAYHDLWVKSTRSQAGDCASAAQLARNDLP